MIIMVFDPRVGKRVPIEVAAPKGGAPPPSRAAARSGDGPEHRQETQDDHNEDQHETEHAAAPKMLPRETL